MTAPRTSQPNRWITPALAVALAVVTFLVFVPARQNQFLNWDDLTYVADNDHVKGGVTWEGIVWSFTSSHSANWHPLTWISHMLDCQIYGLQPGGHHVTNVLFHSVNAALLFLLLRALTSSTWRSVLVAAIFAIHPLRVESVAWLSERKDVLSLFFGLLTLIAYTRYVNESKARGPNSKTWYGAAFVLFALGLMSKPMLVTWPCVMLVLDYWPLARTRSAERGVREDVGDVATPHPTLSPTEAERARKTWQRLAIEKIPFFMLAMVSCIVTVIAQKQGGAVASFKHVPLGLRLQNAAVACVEYLAKFFWPGNLAPIYPLPTSLAGWQVVGAIVLLTILTIAAWMSRKQFPFTLTGWFWFLGTLVPVIGIVQVGSQALADRYTYIPMIGIALVLVWWGGEIVAKAKLPKIVVAFVAVAIFAALGWRTTAQLTHWKDTETLFRYTLTLSPRNVQALYGLGSHLVDHGQTQEGKRLLEQVIQLQPAYVEAIGTLASTLDGEGRYAEAVRYYDEALKAQSNHPGVLNNFAWLRATCPDAALRDGAQAVRLATQACELTGWSKPIFIGTLAAAQAETGDFQTATATAERAAALAFALRLNETAWRNRELMEFYRQGKAAHGGPPKVQ